MHRKRTYLYEKEDYVSPTYGGFIPFVEAYLQEKQSKGKIIIVPGGAYSIVAAGEAEPVAMSFYNKGYDAYVLCYTCALFSGTAVKKAPLKELGKAINLISKDGDKPVILCGFSAGGNLVATFTGHLDDEEIWMDTENTTNSPIFAQILCYPVITAGENTHADTIKNLWGINPTEEQLRYSSAELHVSSTTPATFLWHTSTDADVSVENSYLYAKALQAASVKYALHIFSEGSHGMSIATEEWAEGNYGSFYSMDQFFKDMQYKIDNQIQQGEDSLPPVGTNFANTFESMPKEYLKNKKSREVAQWVDLACEWLEGLNEEQ